MARIAIVEDDAIIAEVLMEALVDAGHFVCGIAAKFKEALTLIQQTSPDLVILDVNLAGDRDGIDLARELQGHQGLKIVFCSGSMPSAHDEFRTLQSAGVLLKPFSPEHLRRVISMALGT